MNDTEMDKFRKLLLGRRDELAKVKDTAHEAAQTVDLDQARVGRLSRMDAMQQQAMSRESNRRRELELRRIIDALSRINDRDYGYCVNCGEDIASNRLEADPSATLCIGCANSLESHRSR